MKFSAHRCRWYFHITPMVYFGNYDFGRGYGVLVDWLGWTFEVNLR